jgi:hypothetical protein
MIRHAIFALLLAWWVSDGLAEDNSSIKFPSPDGRFALRVTNDLKVDLIDKASGNVMLDLSTLYVDPDTKRKEEAVLLWSADSKWAAYGTRGEVSGSTTVYFWDGSSFKEVALPAKLPEPKIKPRKGDRGVKLKGYAVEPLKWLSPGELQLSSKLMGIGRDTSFHYTGSIVITIAFDTRHRASVKKVTGTKTEVSE